MNRVRKTILRNVQVIDGTFRCELGDIILDDNTEGCSKEQLLNEIRPMAIQYIEERFGVDQDNCVVNFTTSDTAYVLQESIAEDGE